MEEEIDLVAGVVLGRWYGDDGLIVAVLREGILDTLDGGGNLRFRVGGAGFELGGELQQRGEPFAFDAIDLRHDRRRSAERRRR